jgi:FkbM family methyltransferase
MIPTAATLFERLPRTMRRHRLMKAWMALTKEDPIQLVRVRDQSFAYADLSDGFLRLIVIEDAFEEDFFRLADALLTDGGVFLDVGANHGLLSFGLAASLGNKVEFHLFEPNPKLVGAIKKSLGLYPHMKCRVNAEAVADRNGIVCFEFDHEQTGASHISDDGEDHVPALILDDYLQKLDIRQVELLKLDVEGYELRALRGATQNLTSHAIQAIYFEYFEKWLVRVQPPSELLDFLQSLDYEVCFCRSCDITDRGGNTHTISEGFAGHGIPLLPVRGHVLPKMTDLLAVPKENLCRT